MISEAAKRAAEEIVGTNPNVTKERKIQRAKKAVKVSERVQQAIYEASEEKDAEIKRLKKITAAPHCEYCGATLGRATTDSWYACMCVEAIKSREQ